MNLQLATAVSCVQKPLGISGNKSISHTLDTNKCKTVT